MYTYAFLPNSAQILRLPSGIAGSLKVLQVDNLAALVEPNLVFEEVQTSDEQLVRAALAHDRVIRELFQQTPVLPLRFGTRFVSQQGLLEHLEVHQVEYSQKLADVRGKAEYFLKVVPIASPERFKHKPTGSSSSKPSFSRS
jgi:Gas vesicle synthesis protein GvpL/GvpF